jgi:cysteinyl-tRNA synthetase
MNLSDEIRDDVLPFIGVRIQDQGGDKPSLWLFDDKEVLIKERQQKIDDKVKREEEKKAKDEEKKKKDAEKEAKAKISPSQFFKDDALYSKYDDKGIPTHDKEGAELTKGKRKGLDKEYVK